MNNMWKHFIIVYILCISPAISQYKTITWDISNIKKYAYHHIGELQYLEDYSNIKYTKKKKVKKAFEDLMGDSIVVSKDMYIYTYKLKNNNSRYKIDVEVANDKIYNIYLNGKNVNKL